MRHAVPAATPGNFVDITQSSHVLFDAQASHTSKKYLIETMGSGCGWIDYDQNGLLDLYLVNSAATAVYKPKQPPASALYRNNGDGTFTDVTSNAGVGAEGAESASIVELNAVGKNECAARIYRDAHHVRATRESQRAGQDRTDQFLSLRAVRQELGHRGPAVDSVVLLGRVRLDPRDRPGAVEQAEGKRGVARGVEFVVTQERAAREERQAPGA